MPCCRAIVSAVFREFCLKDSKITAPLKGLINYYVQIADSSQLIGNRQYANEPKGHCGSIAALRLLSSIGQNVANDAPFSSRYFYFRESDIFSIYLSSLLVL